MGEIKEALWKPEEINWKARDYIERYERKPEVEYKSLLSSTRGSFDVHIPTWISVVFAVLMGSLATLAILRVLV